MSNGAKDLIAQAKALYAEGFTRNSTREMRAFLEQALTDTGDLAAEAVVEACALLADIMICEHLNRWGDGGEAQLAEAEKRIRQALQIAPGTALAHYAKGFLHRARGQHELALAAFRETLEHNPRFTRAHAQTGAELLYLGRPQEALPHIEKAIALDPDSPSRGMFYWIMGRTRFFLAQYGDAIPWLEKSIPIQKDLWYTRLYLVSAYALTGKTDEAERALKEFNDLFPRYTITRVMESEKTNPNENLFVVVGRRNFHVGLRLAGMRDG